MILKVKLREGMTIDDVLDYFELMQEVFNRRFSMLLKDMAYSEIENNETAIKVYREKAEKSIYMEYFIWRSDELGERIKDELLKKAKQGSKDKITI